MTSAPRGILTLLNTPFDADLELDLASLERAVEAAIADGVAACIAPAVASEVTKLTDGERRRYVETVARVADGRVTVIAGASADDPNEVVRLARHALGVGCDGVLVQVPPPLAGQDQEILEFFQIVETAGMDLLMIQDLDWAGTGMSIELIRRLFDRVAPFSSIKIETVPAGVKYSQVLSATEGQLHVCGGWGLPQMIEGLDRGVDGFTPTAINRAFARVDRLYRTGRRDEAVALFESVVPVLAFACQHIDISIHFLKRYCVRRGIFATDRARPPITEYDAHHERYGDELTERLIELEDALPALAA